MGGRPPRRRGGCLVYFLVVFLVLACAIGFAAWKLRLIHIPGLDPTSAAAAALREAPVDPEGSAAIAQAFSQSGISGARVAMVLRPDGQGNAAIVVLDPATDFTRTEGGQNLREQAREVIRQLVESNAANSLNLERVGLEYRENGKPIVALTAPMSALADLSAGKISEDELLAQVEIKLNPQLVREMIARFQ